MEQTKATAKKKTKADRANTQKLFRQIKIGAGLVIGLGVVLFLLCSYVFFKVQTIQVEGLSDEVCSGTHTFANSCYYADEEIIRLCGVETGDSLVLISKKEIKSTVEKLLPYIGNAVVKRKYPSTLRIIIEDTHAKYAVDAGGGFTLMNEDFKVLAVSDYIPEGCAKLIGVHLLSAQEGSAAEFSDENCKMRLDTVETYCTKYNLLPITKIDISNIANISFTVNKQFTFVLGMLTDLDEKFDMAVSSMTSEKEKHPDTRKIINLTDVDRAYVSEDKSPVDEDYSKLDEDLYGDDIVAVG